MVSKRCTGNNLLNYIKQKDIPHVLVYEFCNDHNSKNYLQWMGSFEINDKTYNACGKTKKQVTNNLLTSAHNNVHSYIRK